MFNKLTVVAELCQNHNGDISILKEMIHAAKESGITHIKVQDIKSSELSDRERFNKKGTTSIFRPYQAEYNRLKSLDLPEDFLEIFINECEKYGCTPIVTPFTFSSIKRITDKKFKYIKVASYDCSSFDFIEKLLKLKKPLIISTGATQEEEIIKTSKILKNLNFSFLHCVSIYPTPLEKCNLSKISFLKKFTDSVGWSDHTLFEKTNHVASLVSILQGAKIIERHFTILPRDKTKDGPVSINEKNAKDLIDMSKLDHKDIEKILDDLMPDWKKCIGNGSTDLSKEEMLNRDYYKGRFISK